MPRELARARYQVQAAARHVGHLDADRTDAEVLGEPDQPLGLGPVITLDTSAPVNIPWLAATLAYILPDTCA